MKYIIIFALFLSACTPEMVDKDDTPIKTTIIENPPADMAMLEMLKNGGFMTGAHTTTGNAQLSKDKEGKLFVVFENFKTDAGPDLRIYLTSSQKITDAVEISSIVKNGSYQIDVSAVYDKSKHDHVLIWCKQFSVLFGYAQLK